jgi:hypothetical protein
VGGHIRDRRTGERGGGVVPAERAAVVVERRVEAIAAQVGEIDAADEGECAVDDHQLFMVAVHGPVALVEGAANARVRNKIGESLPGLRARRMKEWNRSARPEEHAHVDTLRGLGEEVTERDHRRPTFHGEVRAHHPAGDVHR